MFGVVVLICCCGCLCLVWLFGVLGFEFALIFSCLRFLWFYLRICLVFLVAGCFDLLGLLGCWVCYCWLVCLT